MPVALACVYALALLPSLPAIIEHTWWSADSASAGFVAGIYHQPPAGQYYVLGNHGWYEVIASYLLTRGLPAHKALWYATPIVIWALTIALVGVSARRAFGRYGAGLTVAALLCLSPVGLMLVFQPTAHTNVVFHAAALVAVAGWVLPKIQTLRLPVALGIGAAIGAFTGLAISGDAFGLVWAALPFAVACAVCARRGPAVAATRTLAFAATTLIAALAAAALLTAIMHSSGIRVDQHAQSLAARFVQSYDLPGNVGRLLEELPFWVTGSFFGHRMNTNGFMTAINGGLFLLAVGAVLFAIYRIVARGGQHRFSAGGSGVDARLVHVSFWSTCLVGGLLMFVLSSVGSGDYRYLLGPAVATAALLPVCAARRGDWRFAVAAGLTVLAVVSLARLVTKPLGYLPDDAPLTSRDMTAVTKFADRYHATYGYANYWDAVTISWHTHFGVTLHTVRRCGPGRRDYCAQFHSDSFTGAYGPRPGLHTLYVDDRRYGTGPARSWGKPLATKHVGRLVLYAYSYDIAKRFPQPYPGEIREVITGQVPPGH